VPVRRDAGDDRLRRLQSAFRARSSAAASG